MREIAAPFLRLGFTAFGGPAAHIAMMEAEFVHKRKWLSQSEFLDLLSAANLIPGPSSSELALFIGQKKAGWRGVLIAGLCFILPSALIVLALATVYQKYGALPKVVPVFSAVKPVIVAVILQAFFSLSKTAAKTRFLVFLVFVAAVASFSGLPLFLILMTAGILNLIFESRVRTSGALIAFLSTTVLFSKNASALTNVLQNQQPTLHRIFLLFLKVGSIQFGSGYVLIAFLRNDFVNRLHWLTESQLIDAVSIGQFTPGPVFTTATFIGYILNGFSGALVATVGIFLPAFLMVLVGGAFISKLRKSKKVTQFLNGVNAASVAFLAVVSIQLGRTSIIDLRSVLIFAVSAIALIRFKINSVGLILAAIVIGLFF